MADLKSHREQDDVHLFKLVAVPKKMFTIAEWKKFNKMAESEDQPQEKMEETKKQAPPDVNDANSGMDLSSKDKNMDGPKK